MGSSHVPYMVGGLLFGDGAPPPAPHPVFGASTLPSICSKSWPTNTCPGCCHTPTHDRQLPSLPHTYAGSGHGQYHYLRTAPRNEEEREEQRKAARLSLDTSAHGGQEYGDLLRRLEAAREQELQHKVGHGFSSVEACEGGWRPRESRSCSTKVGDGFICIEACEGGWRLRESRSCSTRGKVGNFTCLLTGAPPCPAFKPCSALCARLLCPTTSTPAAPVCNRPAD